MLDPMEIYTYQRLVEHSPRKGNRKKVVVKFKLPPINLKQTYNQVWTNASAYLSTGNLLLAIGALIMSRAFILGELLPFIFAFLSAFTYKRRQQSIVIAAFSILGFITMIDGFNCWSNIITILILSAVINYINLPQERNWWGIPALTTAVLLISKSSLLLINHLNFYQEMVIIFEAMISGVLTFVFIIANDVIKRQKALAHYNFEEMAAFIVLGIGIVMGLNDVNIAGLNVSSILCRLGIMIAAFLWGSGGGTMVGVMSGIIPSLASSVFAQTLGMYAISGLLAGVFKNFGRIGVIIGFMLGTLGLSMFISEAQVTILGMWETGIASLIFFFLPESLKEKLPFESLGSISGIKENDLKNIDNRIRETAQNRIHHLAHVFDELSSTFTQQSDFQSQPRKINYLNYLYDELSRGFCEGCSRHRSCWDRNCYSTSHEILDIFTIAEAQGQINYEECPPEFKRKCLHGRELINAVNYLFDNLRMNEYWSGKISESRELVATQLKGVSQVVENLAEEIDIQTVVDFELRAKLLKSCKRIGINLKDVTPIINTGEQLRINVVAGSCVDGTGCDISIAPAISSIIGDKMEVTERSCPRFMGKGACEFTLVRSFAYKVISAAAQVAREDVCGDSYIVTTLKEGKELAVLSDGMGVGERASVESRTAVNLLENLLNSGFDRELALKTINSVLLLRSTTETYTTMDMVMIDLYTGDIDLIKTASAPTFIKRGKQVSVINSNSLPIGILSDLEVINEKRSLCPRDIILMVSDGVMEASRSLNGERWITQLLADLNETDPQVIAELIVNKAMSLAKGTPRDDITVICMRIELS